MRVKSIPDAIDHKNQVRICPPKEDAHEACPGPDSWGIVDCIVFTPTRQCHLLRDLAQIQQCQMYVGREKY